MNSITTSSIFIVEDDRIYGELIKSELERNNFFQLELHNSGEACIDNLYKMPDIVFLDYDLEGEMNGIEVLKTIKAFNPDTQVIMLSGQEQLNVAVNSLKYGAFDYVIKNDSAFRQITSLIKKVNEWNGIIAKKEKKAKKKAFAVVGLALFASLLLIVKQLYS